VYKTILKSPGNLLAGVARFLVRHAVRSASPSPYARVPRRPFRDFLSGGHSCVERRPRAGGLVLPKIQSCRTSRRAASAPAPKKKREPTDAVTRRVSGKDEIHYLCGRSAARRGSGGRRVPRTGADLGGGRGHRRVGGPLSSARAPAGLSCSSWGPCPPAGTRMALYGPGEKGSGEPCSPAVSPVSLSRHTYRPPCPLSSSGSGCNGSWRR